MDALYLVVGKMVYALIFKMFHFSDNLGERVKPGKS